MIKVELTKEEAKELKDQLIGDIEEIDSWNEEFTMQLSHKDIVHDFQIEDFNDIIKRKILLTLVVLQLDGITQGGAKDGISNTKDVCEEGKSRES